MADRFSDIFPELGENKRIDSQILGAAVTGIVTNRRHTKLRIFMDFDNMIPKRRIIITENEVKKRYFPDVDVRIIEKFILPDDISPEEAFSMYKDSILDELHDRDRILYQILSKANFSFHDKILSVTVAERPVCHSYENTITGFLDKVFITRFGFDLKIKVFYENYSDSYHSDRDEIIKQRIHEISLRAASADKDEEAFSEKEETKKKKTFKRKTNDTSADYQKKREVRGSDQDVIFGRRCDDDCIPISEITDEGGRVTVNGMIFDGPEFKPIKNEKTIITFDITDFTDSITVSMFVNNEEASDLQKKLKSGSFVKIMGIVKFDPYIKEMALESVRSIMPSADQRKPRIDKALDKRVELHCHTKMSHMDGVSDVKDIVAQAIKFGHKAIAITDHGNVQAFPDAAEAAKDKIKVLYGIEAYLVDDGGLIVTDPDGQSMDSPFVVFDIETTGFSPDNCRIIEIGAVRIENGKISGRFSEFVNPGKNQHIPYHITELTSITDDMVSGADEIEDVLKRFLEFSEGAVFVAHNAGFDMSFIKKNAADYSYTMPKTYMDTIMMARYLMPNLSRFNLDTLGRALGVVNKHHHRAVDDAEATAEIFMKLRQKLIDRGYNDLDTLNESCRLSTESIVHLRPFHCILIAKNDLGRINLYRLVTLSNLKYFKGFPLMPKSVISEYREGLIIGSACSAGQLYGLVKERRPESEIMKVASFYDYLEIQPVGNNQYLIDSPKESDVNSVEDLRDINRRIVEIGKRLGKPVCATCDVHFLNPEDGIYRSIIMEGIGFNDEERPPLFLHTTDEMLDEFSYLGERDAEEVVIKNPNLIADMCEPIKPVRPDKCPPVIPDSDSLLRKICETRAHKMYGDVLPPVVEERLNRELNSIISNGYAVMYIIAQKLVWKSNEDGYLVGSRGSVGSSFVATMAGITEVNPLSPHYLCPVCHYVDFDSPEVKAYAGESGCDMPDRKCPKCGHNLLKEGFDIPFETFLGFKGNKEPDIDLNFSGDYQSKAHMYTQVIFGEGQTFKAGTIGTLQDKTAFGFIKAYFDKKNKIVRRAEINRIVKGCVGVKRSTGQHPGGIIVLPVGEEINTFTPVQHPADDANSDVITTHFDYHKIDGNLLKLDILGHQDPTMIRMLEDLTGLHAVDIPLDDKGVMSIFENTDALELKNPLWKGCKVGTLGIPEFGTDFAMQMLIDAKPTKFSDLIRIAGLAHGTDVWLGNAKTLIQDGVATISTAICCRDDIMVYLIQKGLDPEESFTIMERVRKGKVAKGACEEWKTKYVPDMKAHGVPDWYIHSCEKIKYMFPKAHAAAYVMMAWRVAYCKVYYPLAYYAAYFSIRADAFSYELMCKGQTFLEGKLASYDNAKEKHTAKEDDQYLVMRLVHEMYSRGFEFKPIDLYESDARYFKIVDGKLLPPFNSIDGMGDSAAESLEIAAHESKFLSKNDMRTRGKISKTIIDKMDELGLIDGLPEDNQLSFMDLMV